MINLKFIPPGQFYSARSIRVNSDVDTTFSLYPYKGIAVDDSKIQELKFKLDYHKTNLSIDKNTTEEKYYLAFLKCRPSFPLNWIDLMFKSSLTTLKVTEKEFLDPFASDVFVKQNQVVNKSLKTFSQLILFSALICVLQLITIAISVYTEPMHSLFWVFTSASLVGLIAMRTSKKVLLASQFYSRVIAFLVYSTLFLIDAFTISYLISFFSILLLILVLIQTIRFRRNTLKKN